MEARSTRVAQCFIRSAMPILTKAGCRILLLKSLWLLVWKALFIGPLPTRKNFLSESSGSMQHTLSSLLILCVSGLLGAFLCITTADNKIT